MRKLTDHDRVTWESFVKGTRTILSVGSFKRPYIGDHFTSQSLDLHHMTISEAHRKVLHMIDNLPPTRKTVIVITGLSGIIRREFPIWMSGHPRIRRFEEMNGGGAFRLYLKKS